MVKGFTCIYQFKVLHNHSGSLFILVKKSSHIHKWIKVGDKIKMKYYFNNSVYPIEMWTLIASITENEKEPFKGYTAVGLSILK